MPRPASSDLTEPHRLHRSERPHPRPLQRRRPFPEQVSHRAPAHALTFSATPGCFSALRQSPLRRLWCPSCVLAASTLADLRRWRSSLVGRRVSARAKRASSPSETDFCTPVGLSILNFVRSAPSYACSLSHVLVLSRNAFDRHTQRATIGTSWLRARVKGRRRCRSSMASHRRIYSAGYGFERGPERGAVFAGGVVHRQKRRSERGNVCRCTELVAWVRRRQRRGEAVRVEKAQSGVVDEASVRSP